MVNPHPKENQGVETVSGQITWLAYFAARCPIAYKEVAGAMLDHSFRLDCEARVEWARIMLHTLWPVKAQNSGNTP